MIEWAQSLLIAAAIVGIPLSLLLWVLAFDRLVKGQPLIPWSPRRPVPWTILDLLVLILIGIVGVTASNGLVANEFGFEIHSVDLKDLQPDQQMALLIATSCSSMIVLMLSLAVLRFRAAASLADLGISPLRIGQDLLLGLTAFIMLVVPMLAIQLIATQLIPTSERHPFVDIILQSPDVRFLTIVAFAAIVVAPLAEEFLFRVILLGWMERVLQLLAHQPRPFERSDSTTEVEPTEADEASVAGPLTERQPIAPPEVPRTVRPDHGSFAESPFASSRLTNLQDDEDLSNDADIEPAMPFWWFPILATGLLFGLAHWGQGPAPIALFFLGCGLAYVYHRTHRVLPCITIHMLVNLLAIAQLGIYIAQQAGP